jgi:hypothetical protein
MSNFIRKIGVICLITVIIFTFVGCSTVDQVKVKYGIINENFEYMKNDGIDKILISSTRDKSFKFTVTDQKSIRDLYNILSKAKKVSEKSSLDPDYQFEMYTKSGEAYKFNYVTGLEKQGVGNFYSDDSLFIVSKRIDNDIISNLWSLRKPKEFYNVYYNSILAVLKKYNKDIDIGKVGIDLDQDVEMTKYMFSLDLQRFKSDLNEVIKDASLVKDERSSFDTIVTVKTYGYKTDVYKAVLSVFNRGNNTEVKYYIDNIYNNGSWNVRLYDKKPDNFDKIIKE